MVFYGDFDDDDDDNDDGEDCDFSWPKNRIGKKNTHTRTHAQSENGGNFVGGIKSQPQMY